MTTKTQVVSKAQKTGCLLDINDCDVALHAPKGKLLNGELHISVYEMGLYKQSEIWSNLMSDMSYIEDCDGSQYCNCEVTA